MNRRQLLLGLIGVPAAALAAKAVADDGVSLYNSPHPGWDDDYPDTNIVGFGERYSNPLMSFEELHQATLKHMAEHVRYAQEYTIVKEECEDLTDYGELGRKYHEALIKATNEDARIAREETLQHYFASPSGLWLPR